MMTAVREIVQGYKDSILAHPFWRLVSHFGMRLFSGTGDSREGGLGLSAGAILAMLAAPGGFISILLLDKYSSLLRFIRDGNQAFDPYQASLSDQYFFFTFSMAITGIVTVLKWDSIFPSRRDYMNLAPLPIATRRIFFANITAIIFIAVAFAVDVNAASSILFPMEVTMEEPTFMFYLRFASAHFLGVMLCSLFIFFALFALIGTLMTLLPEPVFRRISVYLRVAIVMLLLGLLSTTFAIPALLAESSQYSHSLLRWLPPAWFLGLSRTALHKSNDGLLWLGRIGLWAMAWASVLAPLVYIASYYRYFIRIPETLDTTLHGHAPRTLLPAGLADALMLRSPFERAGYRFVLKTLLRSERHSLLFGAFAGLGLVLAFQVLALAVALPPRRPAQPPSQQILAVPFVLAYFIICGLRVVFDSPAELRANWVFQIIVDRERHRAAALARKAILTFILPWAVLVCLPICVWFWGWSAGMAHVAVLLACCSLLIEIVLGRFSKVPFTCSYPAWKQSATVTILFSLLGFYAFAFLLPELERALLARSPLLLWGLPPLVLLAGYVLRKVRADEYAQETLIFEDLPAPAFETLNLSGR
jgi:hypothetical protein